MLGTVRSRLGVTFVFAVPMLSVYVLLNEAVPSRFDLAIALDHAIPFLPWTLPLYMSLYVFVLIAVVLTTEQNFRQALAALIVTAALSFALFMLIPAAYPQPDPSTMAPPWDFAYRRLHEADGAQNTFPSLHVGFTAGIAWMLRHHRLKVFWFIWGAAIVLTTLTTKQHFVVDVIGGLVVALVAHMLASRFLAKRFAD